MDLQLLKWSTISHLMSQNVKDLFANSVVQF